MKKLKLLTLMALIGLNTSASERANAVKKYFKPDQVAILHDEISNLDVFKHPLLNWKYIGLEERLEWEQKNVVSYKKQLNASKEKLQKYNELAPNYKDLKVDIHVKAFVPDWDCGPCNMGDVTLDHSSKRLEDIYDANIYVEKIVVTDEIAKEYGINSVPTYFVSNNISEHETSLVGAISTRQFFEYYSTVVGIELLDQNLKEIEDDIYRHERDLETHMKNIRALGLVANLLSSNNARECANSLTHKKLQLPNEYIMIACENLLENRDTHLNMYNFLRSRILSVKTSSISLFGTESNTMSDFLKTHKNLFSNENIAEIENQIIFLIKQGR